MAAATAATSSSSANTKQRVGVADYFAILGVGEDLIWRHAQQQQQTSNHVIVDETTEHNEPEAEQKIPEEDDAMMMERFYREIVHCDIVLAEEQPQQQQQQTGQGESENESVTTINTASTATVIYPSQPTANTVYQQHPQHPQQSHIPVSQSSSWDTTVTSTTIRSTTSTSNAGSSIPMVTIPNPALAKTTAADIEPMELEGWTVVQKTRPASVTSMNHHPQSPKQQQQSNSTNMPLWNKGQVWEANLEPLAGITGEIQRMHQQQLEMQQHQHQQEHNGDKGGRASKASLKDLRKRVQSTFQSKTQQWIPGGGSNNNNNLPSNHHNAIAPRRTKYYLTYKRRSPEEPNLPAIADVGLFYVQIHKSTIIMTKRPKAMSQTMTEPEVVDQSISKSRMRATSLLEAGKQAVASRLSSLPGSPSRGGTTGSAAAASLSNPYSFPYSPGEDEHYRGPPVPLESFLVDLPSQLHEWVIPSAFSHLRFPKQNPEYFHSNNPGQTTTTTILYSSGADSNNLRQGVEAVDRTPPRPSSNTNASQNTMNASGDWKERLRPRLLDPSDKYLMAAVSASQSAWQDVANGVAERVISGGGNSRSFDYFHHAEEEDGEFIYVPILALRRQRTGEEERFSEDPALVDIAISFKNSEGSAVLPAEDVYVMGDDFEDDDDDSLAKKPLHKTSWKESLVKPVGAKQEQAPQMRNFLGSACLLVRRNIPMGFCDAAFSTRVLDRFPYKNYKGLPLPEEELPMFCYPTGCRLHRAKYSDAPLPQYYGFVVKNERGDSIYVSCVSFMEPLTTAKREQLSRLSEKRRRISLPHKRYWARKARRRRRKAESEDHTALSVSSPSDWIEDDLEDYLDDEENSVLTAFDQMTTFENKTICIVSRWPYWTAFRRFLSHLHSISGSSSELPLERYISHLLLSVPVPRPGGPNILIPLPTFSDPMMLSMPPQKDLPLFDLPFDRLVSCLDVPTVVTTVIGFLALERKVIVMSSRPSLVLDVCECARSLLFPFELVAPYVPRLTEPFMSCLDFPGAIFVGIHDDGTPDGLAATVRQNMPEDSTIIDLDTGTLDCSGDRMAVLNNTWGIIPPGPRSVLISEIETLCRDASIVPGQEPLDSQLDAAFEASIPNVMVEDQLPLSNEQREPFDDRALRDAFMRFFCSVLAGYERHLVVPDVDFLISGNEWFDSKAFLASASEEKVPFLGALVSTQLFQSFIQRRTEASDVHLLLFDECLQEYHSSNVPYGRLGGDVESVYDEETGKSHMLYSLLVDQSAVESHSALRNDRSFDTESRSDAENSSGHQMTKSLNSDATDTLMKYSDFGINSSGDWVTVPSKQDIPNGACFIYCVDGNPIFPDRLNADLYVPRQPESWLVEMSTVPTPMLTRSSIEREEAERRRKFSTSYRGLHSQRKCLWQLPKLMGSHFLGTWLLCIPGLVSQPHLSHEHQSRYLLRAFGALRTMRVKHKIVPDEAAYRALIVACGRTKHDRRSELVKLFGLLRSDGIFPSAVTLGQYTRALAEGYSKRSVGGGDEETASVTMTDLENANFRSGNVRKQTLESLLDSLDGNLGLLEDSGRKWRQKMTTEKEALNTESSDRQKKRHSKSWFPVVTSSSFVPANLQNESSHDGKINDNVCLMAMWSRTVACNECAYIPLDEETMGGWDAIYGGEHDVHGAITCPRCGSLMTPKLAYKELSLVEALQGIKQTSGLPPQITSQLDEHDCQQVTYLSPSSLRDGLEQAVDEHGEGILEREKLRETYPELFFNLWWFCARFQLPLPLGVSRGNAKDVRHYCAVAAWDYEIAMRGCWSCAKVLLDLDLPNELQGKGAITTLDSLGDYPLLAKINLSGYYANVWDHPDLSEILVELVQACDKRDFRPVVESVMQNGKLDCYRTILYLAKYQCTSAFHAFFPATIKACKGYHFWCPIAPVPIFDHLFREAVKRARSSGKAYGVVPEVSDVPLAFRSVFGHLM